MRNKRMILVGAIAVLPAVAAGFILLRCDGGSGPLPISLHYIGNGRLPNGLPTFAFTNHTSKTLWVGWVVEVRNGTNWIMDPAYARFQHVTLASNARVDATIDFSYPNQHLFSGGGRVGLSDQPMEIGWNHLRGFKRRRFGGCRAPAVFADILPSTNAPDSTAVALRP